MLFLARSSTEEVPLLVGIVSDGRDRRSYHDFISVQSNGTAFAGPDNDTVLFAVDITGTCWLVGCLFLARRCCWKCLFKAHSPNIPLFQMGCGTW